MNNESKQPFHRLKLTRRKLLSASGWAAAATAVGLAGSGVGFEHEVLRPIFDELKADWQLAAMPNKDFLRIYADQLRHVRFGTSYSPEYLRDELHTTISHEAAFSYLQHVMGIQYVRWGVRWNRCVDPVTQVLDLEDGLRIADALQRFNMYDTFTNGFKVFRWGEVFIDPAVIKRLPSMPSGTIIGSKHLLAQESQHFVDRLLSRLKEHHRPWRIQPVNEPFNPFGLYKWITGMDFLEDQMDLTARHFPGVPMLINTAGLPQSYFHPFGPLTLDTAIEMAQRVRHKYAVTVGFDYYYDMPQSIIPYYSKHPFDMIAVLYVHSGRDVFQKCLNTLNNADIDWECTEFQQEWRNFLPEDPVTSSRCLKYGLIRFMKIMPNRPTQISLWGTEQTIARAVAGKTSPEEREKFQLIRDIQEI